ncbi:hypothetical protein [Paracoccus luteus]|uniref:hypothetical protein n=1 Tax=Paracoccus luteus TaxID=2508543 RepID=UPI00106FA677|nr:hypothetical protein [Paracoccus luteus]
MCVYLRYDLDEQSGHFHGLLSDRVFKEPSMRFAAGKWLYRTTHHRCVGGVGDERRGYEVAQDVIAAWFSRDEYRRMNIVRGEQRAKATRDAVKVADAMLDEQSIRAFFGDTEAEPLPDGSTRARRKWIMKKQAAEAASRSGRLRKGAKQDLALDLLELIGALDPQVRHRHQTQRARDQLLMQFHESHGTPEELIRHANDLLAGAVEKARRDIGAAREEAAQQATAELTAKDLQAAERRAEADCLATLAREEQDQRAAQQRRLEDDAAARNRQAEDEAAIRKRLVEDRKAEAERARKARALAEYEEALRERETETERKAKWLTETIEELRELGVAIRSAAVKLGLLEVPFVRAAMQALRKVDLIRQGRERER